MSHSGASANETMDRKKFSRYLKMCGIESPSKVKRRLGYLDKMGLEIKRLTPEEVRNGNFSLCGRKYGSLVEVNEECLLRMKDIQRVMAQYKAYGSTPRVLPLTKADIREMDRQDKIRARLRNYIKFERTLVLRLYRYYTVMSAE